MWNYSPRDCGPGGQWLGFIFIWWGIVLIGSCPSINCPCLTKLLSPPNKVIVPCPRLTKLVRGL